MVHSDIERYLRNQQGITTNAERERELDNLTHYRDSDLQTRDSTEPTEYDRGFFLPPGFLAGNVTDVAAPATNQANAMYLGPTTSNLAVVTISLNVTTALVATTWAEIAIASSLVAVLGAGAGVDLIPEGFTAVGGTFNSTGVKYTDISVNIGRGAHVWCVWGSQASTPFAVRGGLGDAIASGRTLFAAATRPSTMANPTTFTVSSSATIAAWMGINW